MIAAPVETAIKGVAAAGALLWGVATAWSSIEQKIERKADAREVQELRAQLQEISRDVRMVRMMLCDGKQADSYCRITP
jgi:outer membrane murein-binding lipoprotein Lpp